MTSIKIYLTGLLTIATVSLFGQTLINTNLPIIKINTGGAEIPDDPKIIASMGIINGTGSMNNINDPFTDYDGKIGIETRGNSTQGYEKKNYSIELRTIANADTSISLLGMPKEEDWILHAMVIDKTLLRIPMSFYLMQRMGHYSSRWVFVEVMLNGDYQGVYILTERIKRGKDRVDIAKLKKTDLTGTELTGGYILRIDWVDEDSEGFESPYSMLSGGAPFYQWYYPKKEKIQPAQKDYIETFMTEFEEALISPTKHNSLGKHYSQYIDLTSFADFFIMCEFSRNSDAYNLSTYVYKEKMTDGNKLKAGPIWDFDQTYGMSMICENYKPAGWNYQNLEDGCAGHGIFWWDELMKDEVFQNHLKCRWELHRSGPLHKDSIMLFIDTQLAYFNAAKDRNFEKWDFIGNEIWPSPMPLPTTYAGEIALMKNWITARLTWLDNNMPGNCLNDVATLDEDDTFEFDVYPNPSNGEYVVELSYVTDNMDYAVYDLAGNIVDGGFINLSFFQLDLTDQSAGIYILEVKSPLGVVRNKLIKQ
ncbi:CotH kinase family protein [Crocinitomix catalasitica]|nr:CotH kinase family protein [Crocinitomix catalasitica]